MEAPLVVHCCALCHRPRKECPRFPSGKSLCEIEASLRARLTPEQIDAIGRDFTQRTAPPASA